MLPMPFEYLTTIYCYVDFTKVLLNCLLIISNASFREARHLFFFFIMKNILFVAMLPLMALPPFGINVNGSRLI